MKTTRSLDYKKWAILIFGMAFIIRLIYLLQIRSNPFFYSPMVDELWNIQWATGILEKSFWGIEVYFRAPLYPYFLALLLKITGSEFFWTRLIQMIIASASVSTAYLLGREFFSERVARLGSMFYAIYGMLIFYEAMFLIPVIFIFLNLLGLYILARNRDNPAKIPFFLAGFVFGLSAIARPNILLVVPFLAIWIVYRFRRKIEIRSIVILLMVLFIGVALPIAPVTARNYIVADDFILISSQGGVNLYLGNNKSTEGLTMMMPEIALDASIPWTKFIPTTTEFAEKDVGHPLKPSEVSAFWTNKAKQFIFENPGHFIGLTYRKLVYFFSGFENSDQHDIYDFRKYSSLLSILIFDYGLKFPFGLFGPLGLIGLGLCYRKRAHFAPLLIFFFAYIPTVILFLVTARHRLTVIPIMLLFSAYAAFYFWDKIKQSRAREIIVPTVVLAVLLVAMNTNFFDMGLKNQAQVHQNLALTYARQEKYDEAVKEYKLALKETPGVPALHFGLGTVYKDMKRFSEAIEQLTIAVSIIPDYSDAYINLGVSYEGLGEYERAEMAYRRVATLEPDKAQPYIKLGDLYMTMKEYRLSAENFSRAVQLDPDNHVLFTKLGVLFGHVGDTATAFDFFHRFVEIEPGYAAGYLNWGNVLLVNGDTTEAIIKYNTAKKYDYQLIEPYYNLAILYIRLGDLAEAKKNVDSLLLIEPDNERGLNLQKRLGG
jgi:tetratricopeptide (TPR) repeat protein